MGNLVSALASGVVNSEGAPAASKITANTRVQTSVAPVGLLTDVMQFTGASPTGNWVLGSTRVMVIGIPVITQASTGVSYSATGPTGPMTVVGPDPRVSAL